MIRLLHGKQVCDCRLHFCFEVSPPFPLGRAPEVEALFEPDAVGGHVDDFVAFAVGYPAGARAVLRANGGAVFCGELAEPFVLVVF